MSKVSSLRIIENLEKVVLLGGGVGILGYMIYLSRPSPPLEGDFNITHVFFWGVAMLIMSSITYLPYFTSYLISNIIHKNSQLLSIYLFSLLLSVSYICVSFWLYHESWQTVIAPNANSTGALIFGVLPIYLLIGSSVAYGILLMAVKESA